MTFKGPVVWLVNSFWQAQDNPKPQQCVNTPNSNDSKCFSMASCITASGWLCENEYAKAALPHRACMCVTHTQVRACLRVEGKHSNCRSHHKKLYVLKPQNSALRCQVIQACVCMRGCLYQPPTIWAHLARDEREPLASEFTRKGAGTLMTYVSASVRLQIKKTPAREKQKTKTCESSLGR